MIRLILMRHAKSSWAAANQSDFDRPLNDRGRRGAALIGRWLGEHDMVPAYALVSPAARTQETWALVQQATGPVPAALVAELYHADPASLLRVLRRAPDAGRLLVLGHQPGIGETARRLLAAPPDDPRFRKYPTAATAAIDFDAPGWAAVEWGSGRLAGFVTPKTLDAA